MKNLTTREYYPQILRQKEIGRRKDISGYPGTPTCRFCLLALLSWFKVRAHLADLLPSCIRNLLQDYKCSHLMGNGAIFDITRITLLWIWEIAWNL